MKSKAVSLLLAVTLFGMGFGFFGTTFASDDDETESSRLPVTLVREFKAFPTSEEQHQIVRWMADARAYSDRITFSFKHTSDAIEIVFSSSDSSVVAWLQSYSRGRSEEFIGHMAGESELQLIDYDIHPVADGVSVSIGSGNKAFVGHLSGKLGLEGNTAS